MLAGTRHQTRGRRGVVLILVLGMLGLLALIGVMFATFSGQARINARNFAESVVRAQRDELMDFALQQLITDTADARSVIRGHSLARDMFGNDAVNNGYLAAIPGGGLFQITQVQPITNANNVVIGYYVSTNIPTSNQSSLMYGYDFTRWTMRVRYVGPFTPPQGNSPYPPSPYPVSQTFEIVLDDYGQLGAYSTPLSNGNYHVFRIAPFDTQTVLNNPTLGYITTNPNNPFPGWPAGTTNAAQMALNYALNGAGVGNVTFTLDGRWLHAFNGQGMGALSVSVPMNTLGTPATNRLSTYGNFRYNGPLLQAAALQLNMGTATPALTGPDAIGMDEDYDSCDLENWFLAIQSADGQVIIPSFHRPGIIRYDPNNPNQNLQANDWGMTANKVNFRALQGADSMARILRPVAADGNDQQTFKDLTPDPTTGKITYDVDNDGDGVTDSVWLDLGYPARRDSAGNLYKPLFSFMVIGLNGRIPLNTAGNLAGGGVTHAQHLGNSVSEIDPQYGLQNAYVPPPSMGLAGYTAGTDTDPFNQMLNGTQPGTTVWAGPNGFYPTANAQVDNSIGALSGVYQSIDVRLTQLRNLLAGTRPQLNPAQPDTTGTINGDTNLVWGSFPGQGAGAAYAFPNSIADFNDIPSSYSTGNPLLVQRMTTPVPGRWGEAAMIPGVPFVAQNAPAPLGLVQPIYSNPIRAGYSFDMVDLLNNLTYNPTLYPLTREAADDDNNAFDIYPMRILGEVGDADFYDSAGALILPVERMRRFVTPVDINGTGSVLQWRDNVATGAASARGRNRGPDHFGRVQFNSYFRPAGSPGAINITTPFPTLANPTPTTTNVSPYGAIAGGNATIPGVFGTWYNGVATPLVSGTTYLPDVTNNPFHGFEWNRMPNNNQIPGVTTTAPAATPYAASTLGGVPVYSPSTSASAPPPQYPPTAWPTYGMSTTVLGNGTDSIVRTDGLNEADEMNLYTPNPLLDSPYGPSDLEWLYRLQDVDGASITGRLSQLAPVSFTNTIDGQRRRRLYSTESWESSQFVWTPDNPGNAFANNSYFSAIPSIYAVNPSGPPGALTDTSNASFGSLSAIRTLANGGAVNAANFVYLNGPSLAHRGKKINLNYPLPVSNDPNEPVRQKWITDTYQFLKVILPPTSVDSPEELAQLSQFVINIIDFRDPDATMTHWVNPDIYITPGSMQNVGATGAVYTAPNAYTYPSLTMGPAGVAGSIPLDQYGMEYCPVAINEALAYQYTSMKPGGTLSPIYTSRFFIELVNTLTAAYNPTYDSTNPATDTNNYYGYGSGNTGGNQLPTGATQPGPPQQASTLDLGGFTYVQPVNGQVDPYGAGCWDLVFTDDNAMARPDPYRGELVNNLGNATGGSVATPPITTYSLIPLNRDAMGTGVSQPSAPNGGDVTVLPLSPTGITDPTLFPINLPTTQTSPSTNYFYVIGNQPATISEQNPISTTPPTGTATGGFNTLPPPVTQFLNSSFDPMPNSGSNPPNLYWRPGVLPGVQGTGLGSYSQPLDYQWHLPSLGTAGGTGGGSAGAGTAGPAKYYWACLRRPANPFAPVSATNPMCVVDSMRFPFIDGSPPATNQNWTYAGTWQATGNANTIYSAQRLQPYRGGHAVPMPNATGTSTTTQPPDPRYGYTEQIAVPQLPTYTNAYTTGMANYGASSGAPSTNAIYQTLGYPNSGAEKWDYLPFNDRDFSSVAELLLVPGCPPGLFTKQFAEFAPSQMNAANIFSQVTPGLSPSYPTALVGTSGGTNISTVTPTPFATATLPFLSVSQLTAMTTMGNSPTTTTPGQSSSLPSTVPPFSSLTSYYSQPGTSQNPTAVTPPEQPHAFPYLVDKFFYTGASTFYYTPNGAALDPGSVNYTASPAVPVVGGPGGDGWFKMFEFFEVPSQSAGSIGTVAQGSNFDWARQDLKPGLMNLNLLIDEEAFFSVFGSENASYNQVLLNSIELPLLATLNTNTGALTLPYNMPLSQNNYYGAVTTLGNPPIQMNGPPVPLVVSASQITGAPNYAYPITDQTQYVEHGYLAGTDPIFNALQRAAGGAALPAPGNRIKAAFAQFLWARHGGSGYVFGFGSGVTGQNSAVATPALSSLGYTQAIPMERPFHSLSYPDINLTIMRPAALPPSPQSSPALLADPNNVYAPSVYNAQALQYQPTTASTSSWYLQTSLAANALPTYYAPYVVASGTTSPMNYFTGIYANDPVVYTGDPGVRNPYLNTGYVTSAISPSTPTGSTPTVTTTPPYPVYLPITVPNPLNNTTNSQYSVPPGVPLPTNVAFPMGGTTAPTQDSVVMPPPIPAARLLQIPDFYGYGQMQASMYMGIINNNGTGQGNLPPAVSNAGDSGDPWINNQVANQWINPYLTWSGTAPTANMNAYPGPSYTLNNGFVSLPWSGGSFYTTGSPTAPYLAATGALPTTGINYAPYINSAYYNTGPLPALWYFNNAPPLANLPTTAPNGPYLGANQRTTGTGATAVTNIDHRQHPYWRTEMLQKAMNLTTVRTHQYAVWITVGFFQVKRQGDIAMLTQASMEFALGTAQGNAAGLADMGLAFDILGPELGALDGKNVRYRGFFIVDRLKLTGFNPNDVGAFQKAVIYRSVIE